MSSCHNSTTSSCCKPKSSEVSSCCKPKSCEASSGCKPKSSEVSSCCKPKSCETIADNVKPAASVQCSVDVVSSAHHHDRGHDRHHGHSHGHHHGHSHGHDHDHEPKKANLHHESSHCSTSSSNSGMCVAVLRENGSEIDVYDVNGKVVSFAVSKSNRPASTSASTSISTSCETKTNGNNNNNDNNNDNDEDLELHTGTGSRGRKICFSSHGRADVEGSLTQCFDSEGQHGNPTEACFCGSDTAHLHAHVYHDDTCAVPNSNSKHSELVQGISSSATLMALAHLTLHPLHVQLAEEISGKDICCPSSKETKCVSVPQPRSIPVSESLPIACNSREIKESLRQHGPNASHWYGMHRRRMFKIKVSTK